MDEMRITSLKVQDAKLGDPEDGGRDLHKFKRAVCKGVGRHEGQEFKLTVIVDWGARTVTVSVPDGPISAFDVAAKMAYHCAWAAGKGGRHLFLPLQQGEDETVCECRTSDPHHTVGILHRFTQGGFRQLSVRRLRSWS